ncbi:MAG: cytochrome C, partial [Woeseiaceae bacterium]
MKARSVLTLIVVSLFALAACDRDTVMSQRGFRLPDGDAQAGREAFLYMQCHQCHSLKGEQLPGIPGQEPPYVELGGPVTQVKTYGQLVTAIINPSHKLATGYAKETVSEDGESKMYVYNDHMTVTEL